MERRLPSHPLMEKLLPETHGVMVYQEDVIRVAHTLAGMSATQSDILRRGMSGKHRSAEDLNRLREVFLSGCEANGVDSGSALEIWRQLSSFSGYSFCKAHSASFATLSYQVAWLKAYYPAEFMAAVISNGGGFYGMRTYLSECERLGLAIRLPDVNCSQAVYTAEASQPGQPGDSIRVGLGAIKGLRSELILRIPAERERRGPYDSLPGFVRRVRPNEAELEALILCGALDSLGLPRPQLLRLARASHGGEKTAAASQSARIFAASEDQQSYSGLLDRACSGYSAAQLDELEQLYFGILISRHPLRDYESLLRGEGFIKAVDIARYTGRRVRLLGRLIAAKRVNMTGRKAGRDTLPLLAGDYDEPEQDRFGGQQEEEERIGTGQDLGLVGPSGPSGAGRQYNNYYDAAPRAMEFMSMEDLSGTFEVTLFPDVYNLFAPLTREPGPFVVEGVVDEQFGVCSLTASRLQLLSDFLRARGSGGLRSADSVAV
jgi:DNA polymerase III alpha subunit